MHIHEVDRMERETLTYIFRDACDTVLGDVIFQFLSPGSAQMTLIDCTHVSNICSQW